MRCAILAFATRRGFSVFSQYFPKGQNNAYRLTDVGRYYRDNVKRMAHFEHVLPGRVHHVCYEDLVSRPESEIRLLFEYLEHPF
ncbi:MAG TPA: sulfotransferase [Rhizomicrobium sp.]|nr:sulfotransferase [Rhizomicrobium sp.]